MNAARTTPRQSGPDPAVAPSVGVRQVVSVDNGRCHMYGICAQEAPQVFSMGADGRLHYTGHPDPAQAQAVRHAARLCPMQAITVQESTR